MSEATHPRTADLGGEPVSEAPSPGVGPLARFADRWWAAWLFVGAFVLRVHWNLSAHPIGGFMYSDMKGYNKRSTALLETPFSNKEYDAFFPYGATWLLGGVKHIFGAENYAAVGVYQALLGAGVVLFVYLIARQLKTPRPLAIATGFFTLLYYPLISLGGYTLSETPFCFFLCASLWLLLRVLDQGKAKDGWLLGVSLAIGIAVRPQLLVAIALVLGLRFLARTSMPKLNGRMLARIAAPIVVVLAVSSVRLYVHTKRVGLVSENGAINLVFGRCHNKGIYSRPDGEGRGTVRFAPPPLIQFERHSAKHPDHWFQLKPVFADTWGPIPGVPGFQVDGHGCRKRKCRLRGAELEYSGYIGDGAIQRRIAAQCVRQSGLARQAYFSLTHVVQLWAYNEMWPDQANPRPRPTDEDERWRRLGQRWTWVHRVLVLLPGLAGLGFIAGARRRPDRAVLALCFASILLVAAVFVGGVRFRIPYDPLLILLAVQSVTAAAAWLRRPRAPESPRSDDY